MLIYSDTQKTFNKTSFIAQNSTQFNAIKFYMVFSNIFYFQPYLGKMNPFWP